MNVYQYHTIGHIIDSSVDILSIKSVIYRQAFLRQERKIRNTYNQNKIKLSLIIYFNKGSGHLKML